MLGKFSGWDDTIAALATPPGIGAIGVIRLSGAKSLALIDSLFTAKKLSEQPSHTVHVGLLRYQGNELDEAVVTLFKAPRSYTGEDVVEISAHGSPHVLQRILDALLDSGARMAKPGEFTQRAFLNGKMDLIQAEAVADLIASGTDAARKAALHTLKGGFSDELKQLREQLVQFSSLIELELDFSQEDVEFADRSQLKKMLEQAAIVTARLIDSFRLGNVIRQGVSVAIIGKPNAGKSTLLNVLLNENRALVSDIPGTTRDTIEEVLNIDGILFRLIDTAGIREHTSDQIESMGMEKSREKMKAADVVVLLFDVNTETAASLVQQLKQLELGSRHVVLVGNKSEAQEPAYWRAQYMALTDTLVFISAKEHLHIEVLKERLVDQVLSGTVQAEGALVTNARHFHALNEVARSLTEIRSGLEQGIPGDLLALDIRHCLHYLGEITGEVTTEDQLDYIFSKFCIGK